MQTTRSSLARAFRPAESLAGKFFEGIVRVEQKENNNNDDERMNQVKADCCPVLDNDNTRPVSLGLRDGRCLPLLHKGVAARPCLGWMEQQCRHPAKRMHCRASDVTQSKARKCDE